MPDHTRQFEEVGNLHLPDGAAHGMETEQHGPGAPAAEVATADYMANTHTLMMTHSRTATAVDGTELHQMIQLPHGARVQGSALAS